MNEQIDKKEIITEDQIINSDSYATGKRKNSIARVWVKQGNGKILVNGKNILIE